MPKKFIFREEDFVFLKENLEKLGFKQIVSDKKFIGLKKSSKKRGRETGFVFAANGLTVTVWTTWLSGEKRFRETDSGWVVISQKEKPLYFSHPLHRTKNFVLNLLRQAWLAQRRVIHRPICPECKRFMEIGWGRGIKSRYWVCRHHSDKRIYQSWDWCFGEKTKRFIRVKRRKREKYRKKRLAAGGKTNVAMMKRIPW